MIYTELTKKAMSMAYKAHHGQVDKSGTPYIFHPIHLAEQMDDELSCCAALLHDTVEDCSDKTNLAEVRKLFGDDVALLVDGLTKLVELHVEDKEEAHIENLRKMLLAMS